jgi:spore germination protein KC
MKNKIKILQIVILVIILITSFSGCSGYLQLDQSLIVEAVGVDIGDDGIYNVTIDAYNAATCESDDAKKISTVIARGKSVYDALNNSKSQYGKDAIYSQNLAIVIGEKTAKLGIDQVIDFFIRHYDTRPNVKIFISKTTAQDILNWRPKNEIDPASYIANLAKAASYIKSDIKTVTGNLDSKTSDPCILAIDIKTIDGEEKIVEDGIAIFNHEKLAGYLDPEECKGFAMILDNSGARGQTITVDVPEVGSCTFEIENVKVRSKFYFFENRPILEYKIKLDVNFFEVNGARFLDLPEDTYDVVKQQLSAEAKDMCMHAIYRTVKEYDSDTFEIGKIVLRDDTKYYKQVRDIWPEALKDIEFDTYIESDIRKIGEIVDPS